MSLKWSLLLLLFSLSLGEPQSDHVILEEQPKRTCLGSMPGECVIDDGNVDSFVRENWNTEHLKQNVTIYDLWFNLKCDDIFEKPRSVPTEEQFDLSIDLFNSIVRAHTDIWHQALVINKAEPPMHLVEAKYIEGKGRGIFAKERIPKGRAWSVAQQKAAQFYEADQYRQFLLESEVGFACDVLQWAYAELNIEEEAYLVSVDLSMSSMCNDGRSEDGNIGFDEAVDPDGLYIHALRDIEVGEEVLCNYGSFSNELAWSKLGLEYDPSDKEYNEDSNDEE